MFREKKPGRGREYQFLYPPRFSRRHLCRQHSAERMTDEDRMLDLEHIEQVPSPEHQFLHLFVQMFFAVRTETGQQWRRNREPSCSTPPVRA